MSVDMNQVKATLQRELNALQGLAQELNVKAALARADLKTELDQVEIKLRRAHEDIQRMNEHIKQPLHQLESALRTLLSEIRAGLERVRKAFESPTN